MLWTFTFKTFSVKAAQSGRVLPAKFAVTMFQTRARVTSAMTSRKFELPVRGTAKMLQTVSLYNINLVHDFSVVVYHKLIKYMILKIEC